ncbi:MAG TPA: hypothetical protein VKD72_14840 [Gemmataceae bacterium]|nr:hypothetical protein [Gemmataceae bacterium]
MIAQISEELVWSQVVARAWCDEDFMRRLLSDPRATLAEHDLEGPPGTEVEVVLGTEVKVDDTDTVRRFILPASPSHDLIEEDLGGGAVAWWCGGCGRCGACGCRCRC